MGKASVLLFLVASACQRGPTAPGADSSPEAEPPTIGGCDAVPPAPLEIDGCVSYLRQCAQAFTPAGDSGSALYARALGAEQRGDYKAARLDYFTLISREPRSRLVPFAYIAFGELFLLEVRAEDPQKRLKAARAPGTRAGILPGTLGLSESAYEEALKFPVELPWFLARLRLGEVYELSTEPERAHEQYMLAAKFASVPRVACARFLVQAAAAK